MKNILKNSVAISIAFTIANTQLVASTSHCNANENVVFSCSTGKKVVSVCASKNINSKSGYLQYRFGKLGAPEALIPSNPESFRSAVNVFEDMTTSVITFKNGQFSYEILRQMMHVNSDIYLNISNKGKSIATLTCKEDSLLIDNVDKFDFKKIGIRVEN